VNDLVVNDGTPGEKTREIMRLFRETTDAFGRGND
jgi:hypothetical protein